MAAILMTRKEAISKCDGILNSEVFIDVLEALGLIKLEPIVIEQYYNGRAEIYGVIKIEEWPEGLVIWVGGKIKYKSWEDNNK